MSELFFNKKFTVNDVVVDPKSNTIEINDKSKRLEPKLIALLCFFAKNPNEVISRQTLAEELWPNVIVGDEAINRSIFALRNILKDSVITPKFIETIPKKGYRFIAEVNYLNVISSGKNESVVPAIKKKNTLLIVFFSSLVLIAYIKEQPSYLINSVLPVTHDIGSERDIALNSYSQKLLYVNETNQSRDLFLQDLTTKNKTRLSDDEWYEKSPVWITPSTWLYIRCLKIKCQIMRQHQHETAEVIFQTNHHIYQLTFSEKKPNLLIYNQFVNGKKTELRSLNILNGNVHNLNETYPKLPNIILQPYLTSDGDRLFFVSIDAKNPKLKMLNLATKEIETISQDFDLINDISAGLQGNELLISGQKHANRGLWLQPLNGSEPKFILRSSGSDKIESIAIDRTNKNIYYENFRPDKDIVLTTLKTGKPEDILPLNSQATEINGLFGFNDEKVYFVSMRSGYSELWNYEFSTKAINQVTQLQALNIMASAISNNGKYVAISYKTDQLQLAVINLDSGRILTNKVIPHVKYPLSWSNDDEYIYVSEHQTQINLYKYDQQTLTSTLIKSNSGLFAQESVDGDALYFIDYSVSALIKKDIKTGIENIASSTIENLSQFMPGQLCLNTENLVTIYSESGSFKQSSYAINKISEPPLLEKIEGIPKSTQVSDLNNNCTQILSSYSRPPSGSVMIIKLKL